MFHLTIEVPTRQGVTLRGLHYAPDSSPAPTVMALTPYGADRFTRTANCSRLVASIS
jgi:predicted acyl esterase